MDACLLVCLSQEKTIEKRPTKKNAERKEEKKKRNAKVKQVKRQRNVSKAYKHSHTCHANKTTNHKISFQDALESVTSCHGMAFVSRCAFRYSDGWRWGRQCAYLPSSFIPSVFISMHERQSISWPVAVCLAAPQSMHIRSIATIHIRAPKHSVRARLHFYYDNLIWR